MTHKEIPFEIINQYRQKTFRLLWPSRITTLDDAVDFINSCGLISFWPLAGIPMPSLWSATAGDRPVPDAHDDPGHVTWGWKDELLGQNKCFYARILCKRNFFVSLELLPTLYALSNNFGDLSEDHKILYESGEMTNTAFRIYNAILENGPLDTLAIKRIVRLSGKEGDKLFNKAINELQNDLKILPVGISRSGGWRYAFVYNLVPRQFPNLLDLTRDITENTARKALLGNYLRSVGAVKENEIRKLFKWDKTKILNTLSEMNKEGIIIYGTMLEKGVSQPCYIIPDMF